MEDIEYLEEYRDLVLPSISTNATAASRKTNDAKACVGRRGVVDEFNSTDDDDSSSSTIDGDIFEKLFHGDIRQKKKPATVATKKPNVRAGPESFSSSDYDSDDSVYNRLLGGKDAGTKFTKGHTSRESFDSIDALVRDLGEFIDKPVSSSVSKTKTLKATKKSDSATLTPKPLKNAKGRPPINKKVPSEPSKTKSSAGKILPQAAIKSAAVKQRKQSNAPVKPDIRKTAKPSTMKTLQKSTTPKTERKMPQASTPTVRRTILSKKDLGVKKDPEPSVDPLNFDDDTNLLSIANDKADLMTSEDDNDESICYASSDDFSDDSDAEDQTVIDISTDSNFSKANSELRQTPSPNVSETDSGSIENSNQSMQKFLEDTRIYINRKPAKQHHTSDSSLDSLDETHLHLQPKNKASATKLLSKSTKLKAKKNMNKPKLEQVNKAESSVKKKADEKSFTENKKDQITAADEELNTAAHSTSATTEIITTQNKPKAESTPFMDTVKNKTPDTAATIDSLQITNKNAVLIKRRLYDDAVMDDLVDNITLEQIEQSSLELQKQIMEMNNDLELNLDNETHSISQSMGSNEIPQTKSATNSPQKGKVPMPLSGQALKESLVQEQRIPRRVGRPRKDSAAPQKTPGKPAKNRAVTTDEKRPVGRQPKQRTKSCNVPKNSMDSLIRGDLRTPTKESQSKKTVEKTTVDKKSLEACSDLNTSRSKQRTQEEIVKTRKKLKLNNITDVDEDILKMGELSNLRLKNVQQNSLEDVVTTVLVGKTADILSLQADKESTKDNGDKISETLELSTEKETKKLPTSAKKPKKTKSISCSESDNTETVKGFKKARQAKTTKSKEHVFEKPLSVRSNESGRKSLSRECSRTPKKEMGASGKYDTDDTSDNSNLSAADSSDSVGKSQRKAKTKTPMKQQRIAASDKSCKSRSSSQESQSSYKTAHGSELETWTGDVHSGNLSVKHEAKKAQKPRKTAKTAAKSRSESELSTDESAHKKGRKSRKSIKMKMEDVSSRSDTAEEILITPKKRAYKPRTASESSGKSARKRQTLKEQKSKVSSTQIETAEAKKELEKSHKKQKKHIKVEDEGSKKLGESEKQEKQTVITNKDTEEEEEVEKKSLSDVSKLDSELCEDEVATGSESINEMSQQDKQTPKKSTERVCDKNLERNKSKQVVDSIKKVDSSPEITENAFVESAVFAENESSVADENKKDDESETMQKIDNVEERKSFEIEQMETPSMQISENKGIPTVSIVSSTTPHKSSHAMDEIIVDTPYQSSSTDATSTLLTDETSKITKRRLSESSTPERNSPLTPSLKNHLREELTEMTEQLKKGKEKTQKKTEPEPERKLTSVLTLNEEIKTTHLTAEPDTDNVVSEGADTIDEVMVREITSMEDVADAETLVKEIAKAQSLEESTAITLSEDVSNQLLYEPTLSELENADLTSMFADEHLMPSDAMIVEQIVEVEFSEINESLQSQDEVNEGTFEDAFNIINEAKPDETSDSNTELNMLEIPEDITDAHIGGNIVELAELLTTQATSMQEEAALDANIKAANELLNQDPKFAEAILAELAENLADARLEVCTDDMNDAGDDKPQEVTLQFERVCDIELSDESLAKLTDESTLNTAVDAMNVAETNSNELETDVVVMDQNYSAETAANEEQAISQLALEAEMGQNVVGVVALENETETIDKDNVTNNESETQLVTELQTIAQQFSNEDEVQQKDPGDIVIVNALDTTCRSEHDNEQIVNKSIDEKPQSSIEIRETSKTSLKDNTSSQTTRSRKVHAANYVLEHISATKVLYEEEKIEEDIRDRSISPWNDVMDVVNAEKNIGETATETSTQPEQSEMKATEMKIVSEKTETNILKTEDTETIAMDTRMQSDDKALAITDPILSKEIEKTVLEMPIESEETKTPTKESRALIEVSRKTAKGKSTLLGKIEKTEKESPKLLQEAKESRKIATKISKKTEMTATESPILEKKAKKTTTEAGICSEEAENPALLRRNKKKPMKIPKQLKETKTPLQTEKVEDRNKKGFESKEYDRMSNVDASIDMSASSAKIKTVLKKRRSKVEVELNDLHAMNDSIQAGSSKRKLKAAAADMPSARRDIKICEIKATDQTTRTSTRILLKPKDPLVLDNESQYNVTEVLLPSHTTVPSKITEKTLKLFGLAEVNVAACADLIPASVKTDKSYVKPMAGRRRGARNISQTRVKPAKIVVATRVTIDQLDEHCRLKATNVEKKQSMEQLPSKVKTRNSNKKTRKSHVTAEVNIVESALLEGDSSSSAKDVEGANTAEEDSKPVQAEEKEVNTLEQLEADDTHKDTSEFVVVPETVTKVAASGGLHREKRKLRVRVKKTTTSRGKTEADSRKDHDSESHGKDTPEHMLGNTRRSLRKRPRETSESDTQSVEKQTKIESFVEATVSFVAEEEEEENATKQTVKRDTAIKEISANVVENDPVATEVETAAPVTESGGVAGAEQTDAVETTRSDILATVATATDATTINAEATMETDASAVIETDVAEVAEIVASADALATTADDAATALTQTVEASVAALQTQFITETVKSVAGKPETVDDGVAIKTTAKKVTTTTDNVASSTRRLLRKRVAETQMLSRNEVVRRRRCFGESSKSPEIQKILSPIEATSVSRTSMVTPVHLTRAQGVATPIKELTAGKPPQQRGKELNKLNKDVNNMPDIDKRLAATTRSPTLLQKRNLVDDLPVAKRIKPKLNTPKANAEEAKSQSDAAKHANSHAEPNLVPDKDNLSTLTMTSSTVSNQKLADEAKGESVSTESKSAKGAEDNSKVSTIALNKEVAKDAEIRTQVVEISKQQPLAEAGVETSLVAAKPTVEGIAIETKSAQPQQPIAISNATKEKSESAVASATATTHMLVEPKNITRSKPTTTTAKATIASGKPVVAKILETIDATTTSSAMPEKMQASTANEDAAKTNQTVPIAITAAATMNQITAADFAKLAQTSLELPSVCDNSRSRASSKERVGRRSNNPTPTPLATRKSMRMHVTPAKYVAEPQQKQAVQSSHDKITAATPLAAAVGLHKAAPSVSAAVSLLTEPPVPVKLSTNLEALHATRGVKRKAAAAATQTSPPTTSEDKSKRTCIATPVPVPSAGVAAIRAVPVNILQQQPQQQQTTVVPDLAQTTPVNTLQPREYLHKTWQPRVRINRRLFETFRKNLNAAGAARTTMGEESPISIPSTDELLPNNSTPVAFSNVSNNTNRYIPIQLMPIGAEVPPHVPSTFIPIEPKTEILDEQPQQQPAAICSEHSTARETTNVRTTNSLRVVDLAAASRRQQDTNVASIAASTQHANAAVTNLRVDSTQTAAAANEEHIIGRTCIYSYLHPIKYNRSYEKVQLDYCCPNLKGPMIAIDPTRLYHEIQMPVREIPAAIVMTTKVVKSSEYQKNRELLPEPVRLKIERRNGGFSVASFLAAGGGVLHKRLDQTTTTSAHAGETMSAASVTSAQQQIELSTIALLKKRLPPSTTIVSKSNYILATKEVTPTSAPAREAVSSTSVPATQPPPPPTPSLHNVCSIATQPRLELLRNVQLFDDLLQQVAKRVHSCNTQSRQRIISAIVAKSDLDAADFLLGIRLLKHYNSWIDNVGTNVMQAGTAVAAKITTSAMPITARVETSTTYAQPQQDRIPTPANSRPIYDEHKNVIGYQRTSSTRTSRMRNAANSVAATAITTTTTTPAAAVNTLTTSAQLPQCSFYTYTTTQMSNTLTTATTTTTANGPASIQLCHMDSNGVPKNVLIAANTNTNTTSTSSDSRLTSSYINRTSPNVHQRVESEQSELMNVTIAADNFNADILMRDLNSTTSSSASSNGAGAEESILPDTVMVAKEIKSEKPDDDDVLD